MHPEIFVQGPNSGTGQASAAVRDLHQRLNERFGSQRELSMAYMHALEAAEDDDELLIETRSLTPFELAFAELAELVHMERLLHPDDQLLYELP